MKTKRFGFLGLMGTFLLALFPVAVSSEQEPSDYMHGGNAEAFLDSCAGVERMEGQSKQVPAKYGYCFGYILGVLDMHNAVSVILPSPKDNTYCIPDNASAVQLAKVFVKYGHGHPEELHQAGLLVLSNAFIHAFPCK
jgi:hypothetical protein